MENLVADKDVELSEKDEEIQQLRQQLEDAKKPQPGDGVVPGTSVIGGIVPPITVPTTTPVTSTVTTTTAAMPNPAGGIPAFHGYPPAYPVHGYPYYPMPPYYMPAIDPNAPQPNPVLPPPVDAKSQFIKDEVEEETAPEDMDKQTDPLSSDIAAALQNFFWHIHSGKEIVAKLQECERPSNCDALKPLQINEEVKRAMDKSDKTKDSHMHYICNALAKAGQPLAILWSELLDAKFIIQQEQSLSKDDEKIIKTSSGHEINLSYWTDLIKLGLQVLGMASVQCNQKRRHDLKYKLVPAAKELADRDQPLGPELFGENLKEHYKQIQEVAKLTTFTTSNKKKQQQKRAQNPPHPYDQNFLGNTGGYPPWPPQYQHQRPRAPYQHYPPPAYPPPQQQFPPQRPPPPRPTRGRGRGAPAKAKK